MVHDFGLPPGTVSAIRDVFSRHKEVSFVLLYGSRAKGTYKPGSDIDLTILDDGIDLELQHYLEEGLDDLYLPYSIDLSIFHQIENENLIDHINRIGTVFYKSG